MIRGCKCSDCVGSDMRHIALLGDKASDIFYEYDELSMWDFAEGLNLAVHGWEYHAGLGQMMREAPYQFSDMRVGFCAGFRFCEDAISEAASTIPARTMDSADCGEKIDEKNIAEDFRAMVRFALMYAFFCGKYSE